MVLDIVTAILLLGLGSAFLWGLIKLMFGNFSGLIAGAWGKARLREASKRLRGVDEYMQEGDFQQAGRYLQEALLLDSFSTVSSIRELRNHYRNLVSRLQILSSELLVQTGRLQTIEMLLLQRADLLELRTKARGKFRDFITRRRAAPQWSKKEYQERIRLIEDEIAQNTKDIREIEVVLFAELQQPGGKEVLYH